MTFVARRRRPTRLQIFLVALKERKLVQVRTARLRWSRGSVLAFGTQVRGSDFSGRKNPQHAFIRKGSKAVCTIPHIYGT